MRKRERRDFTAPTPFLHQGLLRDFPTSTLSLLCLQLAILRPAPSHGPAPIRRSSRCPTPTRWPEWRDLIVPVADRKLAALRTRPRLHRARSILNKDLRAAASGRGVMESLYTFAGNGLGIIQCKHSRAPRRYHRLRFRIVIGACDQWPFRIANGLKKLE